MITKKKREGKIPKVKLWLLLRGLGKKAFRRLVIKGADTMSEEIFKDFAATYKKMTGKEPTAEMEQAMLQCQHDFVTYVSSHSAKEIVIEAKEYFIRG